MSFFKSFSISKMPVLGVDIGTTSIKVAEIGRSDKKLSFLNYGILETRGYLDRYNEALQTSSLRLSEKNTSEFLKTLVKKSGIKSNITIASIPPFMAFSTLVELPSMSEGEIRKFIEFHSKQYVPMPIETVTLDWIKVGDRKDESGKINHQIFLIAILNEQLEKYKIIFKEAGLTLKAVEIEGMSLAM